MRTVTAFLRKINECDTQSLLSNYQIILELVGGEKKKRKIKALLNLVMVVMNLSKVRIENEKMRKQN